MNTSTSPILTPLAQLYGFVISTLRFLGLLCILMAGLAHTVGADSAVWPFLKMALYMFAPAYGPALIAALLHHRAVVGAKVSQSSSAAAVANIEGQI